MDRGRFIIIVYGWEATRFVRSYLTDRYPFVVVPLRSAMKGLSNL